MDPFVAARRRDPRRTSDRDDPRFQVPGNSRQGILRIPVPSNGGASPSSQSTQPQFQVPIVSPAQTFTPATRTPQRVKIFDRAIRDRNRNQSDVYNWALGGPIGIEIQNSLDVGVRITPLTNNSSDPPRHPKYEFDVGQGERREYTLSPFASDPWGVDLLILIRALRKSPTRGSIIIYVATGGG